MEKYENDKSDFLQTQRIKQLDKYSISIKYSYLRWLRDDMLSIHFVNTFTTFFATYSDC